MSSSSFRHIAPTDSMHQYAATCNPPRRAKRLRQDEPAAATHDAQSSLSSPSIPDETYDDDQDDISHNPPPKRRGRRPGTLSRSAREAQRKINHSLIEKARRTKINDALATLREIVPPDVGRVSELADGDSDSDDAHPQKPQAKPKAAGEKEFKLEILVRTVAYLQQLTDRVKQLEHSGCPHCSKPISFASADAFSSSRMQPSEEDPLVPDAPASASRDSSVAPSRLPSISAWLPTSAEEHRALLRTPSQSPACDTIFGPRSGQLPTPPSSAICAPATNGFQMPPVLTLPSPSTFLPPATPHMQPRFYGFNPRASAKVSPVVSPVYSPEDETAASLLLRMSATSPRVVPKHVSARPLEVDAKQFNAGYALTPSRLLGLSSER